MSTSSRKHILRKSFIRSFALITALSLAASSAWAQNTWTNGASNGLWEDAGNWSGGVPAASDQLILGDDPADTAQIINTGTNRTLNSEILIESTGSRDYSIQGNTLAFVRTGSLGPVGFESGAGTTDLTVNSDVSLSNTLDSGISYLEFTGSGTRSIHINGNISDGGGNRSNRLRMNAANTQLHLSGSNSIGTILFSTGEVVAHSENALGGTQLQGGNSTLSVSSDISIAKPNGSATFLSGNLDVRIREEAASSTDYTLTFLGRLTSSGSGGSITIAPNINSTGRVILNATSGHSNTGVVNDLAVDLGTNGIYRISISSTGYFGTKNGTGIISGQGDVEIDGGGDIYFSAANTYSGSTTLTNASTLLLSGDGSIGESAKLDIGAGSTFDISGITAGGYTFDTDQTVAGSGLISTGDKDLILNGTLAPGSSPGTLTVDLGTGTFSLGATTTLQFELGTASDLVDLTSATGTLDIGSGTLDFSDFSFVEGSGFGSGQYTLFQNAGGISGTFGTTTGSIGSYSGEILFSGNNLILDVTVVPEPGTVSLLLGGLALALLRRRPSGTRV